MAMLLMLVAVLAAGTSTADLQLSARHLDRQTARNLAISALQQAVARLRQNATSTVAVKVVPEGHNEDEAAGYVAYNPNNVFRVAHSVNNLGGSTALVGWEAATVPAYTAHLIATGRYRGLQHRVESVLAVPAFPNAVSSTGPVVSSGGLLIGGLTDASQAIQPQNLRPGSLVSNEDVTLKAGDLVTGDVQAVGRVNLAAAEVRGAIRENADPVELPKADFSQYDLSGRPGLVALPSNLVAASELKLEGFAEATGDIDALAGLVLNNAVVRVHGSLNVTGGVRGVGALIVDGRVDVSGDTQLGTDRLTALMAKGSVNITASASQRALLKGLVYTEGDFSAKYADVLGSLVARRLGPPSTVELEQSRIVHVPMDEISIPVAAAPASAPGPTFTYSTPMAIRNVIAFSYMEIVLRQDFPQLCYDATRNPPYRLPLDIQADSHKLWNYVTKIRFKGNSSQGPDFDSLAQLREAMLAAGVSPANFDFAATTYANQVLGFQIIYFANWVTNANSGNPPPSGAPNDWKLDLTRLLRPEERIRLLFVRDR